MSNMELDQTVLKEADAAKAANNDDKEIAMEDEDSSENEEYLVEELIDYNERLVALKEMLTHRQRACVERNSQIRESESSLRFPIDDIYRAERLRPKCHQPQGSKKKSFQA